MQSLFVSALGDNFVKEPMASDGHFSQEPTPRKKEYHFNHCAMEKSTQAECTEDAYLYFLSDFNSSLCCAVTPQKGPQDRLGS